MRVPEQVIGRRHTLTYFAEKCSVIFNRIRVNSRRMSMIRFVPGKQQYVDQVTGGFT
jgi:hypothetical protein